MREVERGKLFKRIALLCILFLLSLRHLHLRGPGIRTWRLGTPVLGTSGALQLHTFTFFFFFKLLLLSLLKPTRSLLPVNSISQPGQKADPGDVFSGAV